MSKRRLKHDDFERAEGGLWLPKYGLRLPDRHRRALAPRRMPGYPAGCRKAEEEGCPELCTACLKRVYPPSITASISGVTGQAGACSGVNGDWNVPYVSCQISGFVTLKHKVTYEDIFAIGILGNLWISCQIEWWCHDDSAPPGQRRLITVWASLEDLGPLVCVWNLTDLLEPENPYDCEAFLDLDIPDAASANCDVSSSTCTLTAP